MAKQPIHEEIRSRAYQIYLARGGEHGLHEEDWRQAEEELRAETEDAPKAATAAAGNVGTSSSGTQSGANSERSGAGGTSQKTETATRSSR